jgi:hypothetical protein
VLLLVSRVCASQSRIRQADFDLRFLVAHSFLGKADVYWNRQVINGCDWARSILPVSVPAQFGSNCSATSGAYEKAVLFRPTRNSNPTMYSIDDISCRLFEVSVFLQSRNTRRVACFVNC